MSQYMLLVYEEEVERAEQAERETMLPALMELHRGLREAGLLMDVRALRSTESATSVRVREGETELVDGPFAVTKEVLAGYYMLECADLDEALAAGRAAADGALGDDRGAPGDAGDGEFSRGGTPAGSGLGRHRRARSARSARSSSPR